MADNASPEARGLGGELQLPLELQRRGDLDIQVISTLHQFGSARGISFGISGGYAVEAHDQSTGGRVTRLHNDIDAAYYLRPEQQRPSEEEILGLIDPEGDTWSYEIKGGEEVHYFEKNPQSPPGKPRKIELHFYTAYRPPLMSKSLVDSRGEKHAIGVVELNHLASEKVYYLVRKPDWRERRMDDVVDLYRLVQQEDFDESTMLRELEGHIRHGDRIRWLEHSRASRRARKYWDQVRRVISDNRARLELR